jgi:riboflavin synthase
VFTGIVKAVGHISAIDGGAVRRIAVDVGALSTASWQVGDSVAVSGVCLTVVTFHESTFEAELSPETFSRTTLGRSAPGDAVNLEPALGMSAALGGHFVTGHVDGVAQVGAIDEGGGSLRARIEAPAELARFLAFKGSVALDGVSLTVGELDGASFWIDIVPHTRAATTLGALRLRQPLNIEIDIVARYVERLIAATGVGPRAP